MDKIMNKFFKSSIITSAILIILGLLLIFESETTIISISYIIGSILVAIGVVAIINFIRKMNANINGSLDIVYGAVTIILGVLVITNPHAIASIIPFVLGIGIIISSATKLQYALELKQNNNNLWKATMVVSIISAICGVILLFNPFKGAVLFTKIVGIFITIYAILDIISTITIKKNVNEIHNVIERTVVEAEIIDEDEKTTTKNKTKKKTKKTKNKDKDNKSTKEW